MVLYRGVAMGQHRHNLAAKHLFIEPERRSALPVEIQIRAQLHIPFLLTCCRSRTGQIDKSIEGEMAMRINKVLWTVQVLLAFVFLFAGGMKLVLPVDAMQVPVALPGSFIRFIGVAEVLGAIGLVLPWLLRIRPSLTPVAAEGLVIGMVGATSRTLLGRVVAHPIVHYL